MKMKTKKQIKLDEKLRKACSEDNIKGIRRALGAGADPETKNRWGETMLSLAFEFGDTETARLLMDYGAKLEEEKQ